MLICYPQNGFILTLNINIADLNRSTRTLRARATKIIPPHEIEFSEGVSIFIRERKINIIMAHRIKDGQTC